MRLGLVLAIASVLAACSSGPKSDATEQKPAPAVEAPANAPSTTTSSPTATANASSGGSKVECGVQGDERSLEVRAKGKGCELAYTKNGSEGIVATSANGTAHCDTTQKRIKERLIGAGFSCK